MLRDDINNALKDAMKARDERRVSTLRLVNSTLKNADIEARGQGKEPLGDDAVLGVLLKTIKQRQESVELYEKGGRAELAQQERDEIAIITAYLPKQMSDDDVKAAIAQAIAEVGAAGMKDPISMFDTVRIRLAPETEELGLAGLVGTVHGETTPSVLPVGNIKVIGELKSDYAIRVDFEEEVFWDETGAWFAPELLEVVSHDPASKARFEAVREQWLPGARPKWQKTALQSLDLGVSQLTALPPAIVQLTALQSLDLSGNRLMVLPPEIRQLTAL